MSQNFRLFHVSNSSVRNFRIFLLMYTGSLLARPTVHWPRPVRGDQALHSLVISTRRAVSSGTSVGRAYCGVGRGAEVVQGRGDKASIRRGVASEDTCSPHAMVTRPPGLGHVRPGERAAATVQSAWHTATRPAVQNCGPWGEG